MNAKELAKWLRDNPELGIRNAEPENRPMPPAARQWLEADKLSFSRKFEQIWHTLNGPPLKPELKFDAARRWRFDFACLPLSLRIAIELEGGVWSKAQSDGGAGRHLRPRGFLDDIEKYNAAALQGWTVFRLGTGQIDTTHIAPLVAFALTRAAQKTR